MAYIGAFNPDEYQSERTGDFPIIPAGQYVLQLVESEYKDNRKNNGKDIACVFEVMEGEFKGRKIFHDFRHDHESDEAQRIGREQFGAFCRATGHTGPLTETSVLHYKPVQVVVDAITAGTVEKGYTHQKDVNKIKANTFKAVAGFAGNAPAAAAASPPTTAPSDAAPWLKNRAA